MKLICQENINSIICDAIDSIETDLLTYEITLENNISDEIFDTLQDILDKYSKGYCNYY